MILKENDATDTPDKITILLIFGTRSIKVTRATSLTMAVPYRGGCSCNSYSNAGSMRVIIDSMLIPAIAVPGSAEQSRSGISLAAEE